jgi:transcription elongation factor GreA
VCRKAKRGIKIMAEQQFVMTKKNYEDLKKELEQLVKVKRPEIIERIAEARSHGDLSENAEYDAAREEQRSNEGKIAELEYEIKNAVIQDEIVDNSFVHLDSQVTVYDEEMEEEETYVITSVTDVDVMNGRISSESPVGAALLRKRVGDVVTVVCPDGSSYKLKITKIK